MSRIGVLLGTRPELIKCLPLLKSSSMYVPIFVEQHKDLVTAEYTSAKYTITVSEYGDSRLDNIISSILKSSRTSRKPRQRKPTIINETESSVLHDIIA